MNASRFSEEWFEELDVKLAEKSASAPDYGKELEALSVKVAEIEAALSALAPASETPIA